MFLNYYTNYPVVINYTVQRQILKTKTVKRLIRK